MVESRSGIGSVVGVLVLFLLGIVVVVLFSTVLGSRPIEKIKPGLPDEDTGLVVARETYFATCLNLCYKYDDRSKCTEKPSDDSIYDCGMILSEVDSESAELSDSGASSSGSGTSTVTTVPADSFSISGDFRPCSKLRVTFAASLGSISDFKLGIYPPGSSKMLALRNTADEEFDTDETDGKSYTILCTGSNPCSTTDSKGQAYIEFNLPCDRADEVYKQFDYTKAYDVISLPEEIEMSKGTSLIWNCDVGVKISSIVPNQIELSDYSELKPTRIDFTEELRPPGDDGTPQSGQMKVRVILEADTICLDPVTGTKIDDCILEPDSRFGMKYIAGESADPETPSDPHYEFYMPTLKVLDNLNLIRFNIRLPEHDNSDEYVYICNSLESPSIHCTKTDKYLCYTEPADESEDGKDHTYILSGLGSGDNSLDGVCMYKNKLEYEAGCVDIESGEIVSRSESECSPPDYIYRDSTIIKDTTVHSCKTADLEVMDIYPCNPSSCEPDTYLAGDSKKTGLAIIIMNHAEEPIPFALDNLRVTINGNEEAPSIISSDTIEPGKTIMIQSTADTLNYEGGNKDSLRNEYLAEGTYSVVATIDDLGMVKYPVEGANLKSDTKTESIRVYPDCCGTCTACTHEDTCKQCSPVCEVVYRDGVNPECMKSE